MFQLHEIQSNSDHTQSFDILLNKNYTIEEFIQTVLQNRPTEWGRFEIVQYQGLTVRATCSYKCGKLSSQPIPSKYLCKPVMKATARGGWGIMDYKLHLDNIRLPN